MTGRATVHAKGPDLRPSFFKFRVVHGDQLIGQFSNVRLADRTAQEHRGAVVLIYQDGKWLEKLK